MYLSRAFVPAKINHTENQILVSALSVILGVVMLALLAQVKIALPWTPVPVTGQTFGVAVLALMWGSRLSLITFLTYLGIGFLGAPVFAGGLSGLLVGPTFGYLIGMMVSSWVVGKLSDRGWGESFKTALGACYIGSLLTFLFGVAVLSLFIPTDKLLIAGVLPFLPGDLIKNILAATLIRKLPLKN
jgi:biotin transport system substrate-specific component